MTKNLFFTLTLFTISFSANGQTKNFADSIRKKYKIPELAYAVVSSTHIHELQSLGFKRINSTLIAEATDRFRIGSNTKTVTSFIAALLVKQGKLSWNTKFFDLYPELKSASHSAYHQLTLLNLLTFRTKLFQYGYDHSEPTKEQFKGNEDEQRYQFARWFFQHQPASTTDTIYFSNLGYVAAGLMLEKVTGKPYKQLVTELGTQLGINFGFGPPNETDTLQPWGHDKVLKEEAPGYNYKLNWLLPAGNINASLPAYAKFIQLHLQGLLGQSKLLTKEEFHFLHYGLPNFAVGWFWLTDEDKQVYSYHLGNPGTFLAKVYVFKDSDKAYLIFTNCQTDDAYTAIDVLFTELKKKYGM